MFSGMARSEMTKGTESSDAGISALTAFMAVGTVAVIAILAVMIAVMVTALSGPSSPVISDNEANVTPSPMPTPTPTPEPHKLRIVVAEGPAPDPTPTPKPDDGMYFEGETDKTARHIAYAFQPNVSGIADFTASWIVPEQPRYNGDQKHTIFLWTGIQHGSDGLIQAVLEWDHDHTGKYWTLACWAVNAKENNFTVSSRIRVDPGDLVKAEMRYETDALDPGRKVWHIVLTDETNERSTELIDSSGAVTTNQDVFVFSGVLEGIAGVADGDDLPGDMMFDNITYKDEYGNDMPIYLTGYVDPAFRRVAVEYEDGPAGSPVIIRTNYSD